MNRLDYSLELKKLKNVDKDMQNIGAVTGNFFTNFYIHIEEGML